jgi:dihydroorotase/N-acyl-D-amino-acid deacylase
MDEEDVERIMQYPHTMHASDGRLSIIHQGHPHPRAFGTFPRVLGHYVREKGVLTLEDAIRKMTSLPASKMGLKDRGLLKEGYRADVTVFNPETIVDKATFEDPNQFPEGIDYVIVNGQVALEKGDFKAARFGTVLRKD